MQAIFDSNHYTSNILYEEFSSRIPADILKFGNMVNHIIIKGQITSMNKGESKSLNEPEY